MGGEEMKRWNQISGFCFPEEVKELQGFAKDKVCLEMGSFHGKSTIALAEVAKIVYAVDTFRASGNGAEQVKGAAHEFTNLLPFCTNIFGHTNIRICIGLSHEIAKTFDDNSFDLIFVDGSHKYEDVLLDKKSWWPKLKTGGIMAFHDYKGFPGVTKAVDEVFNSDQITGPVVSLCWVTKDHEKI